MPVSTNNDSSTVITANPTQLQPTQPVYTYAGFWRRFLAYFVDSLILNTFLIIPYLMFFMPLQSTLFNAFHDINEGIEYGSSFTSQMTEIFGFASTFTISSSIVIIVYSAIFESSKLQATPGKLAVGLIVTDMNGYRLSFWRSVGRNAGKILSGLFFNIGYIMAGFTDKKQALHDIIAETLVLKRV